MPAGTVVASGSLVSPGGQQGPSGQNFVWQGFISKTAAYTLTSADSAKYIICSGGSWTLTFPAPAPGLIFQVRNDMGISGTTGIITLQPTGGTIDGQSSLAFLPQQECTIITDGTNWRTFGLKREVILGTQDITTSTASGTVLLPVGYRYFELEFTGFIPAISSDYLGGRLSMNGGSTWITSASYFFNTLYNSSSTVAANFAGESSTSMQLIPYMVGGTVPGSIPATSRMTIFNGGANQFSTWRLDGWARTGGLSTKWNQGGTCNGGAPVNALQYFAGGGNILNLFLTVKGVV